MVCMLMRMGHGAHSGGSGAGFQVFYVKAVLAGVLPVMCGHFLMPSRAATDWIGPDIHS